VVDVMAYGSPVKMAEPEKTILDSLVHPEAAGDIPEIAAMLWQGKNRLDWPKLVAYAIGFRSQSLVQRLGFLLDTLQIEIPGDERSRLIERVQKTTCYLGRPAKWGKGGPHHATWQVVANVPEREIRAEIPIG